MDGFAQSGQWVSPCGQRVARLQVNVLGVVVDGQPSHLGRLHHPLPLSLRTIQVLVATPRVHVDDGDGWKRLCRLPQLPRIRDYLMPEARQLRRSGVDDAAEVEVGDDTPLLQ